MLSDINDDQSEPLGMKSCREFQEKLKTAEWGLDAHAELRVMPAFGMKEQIRDFWRRRRRICRVFPPLISQLSAYP